MELLLGLVKSQDAKDWAVIISVLGLLFSIWTNTKRSKALNKQLKLNFFADYTKRYQEIQLNFPENINDANFCIESLNQEVKDKTLRYMRAYFDLCSEEYYLGKNGNVDKEIFNLWERGIERALSKPAFQQAWERISRDTFYDKNFMQWVNSIIQKDNMDSAKPEENAEPINVKAI